MTPKYPFLNLGKVNSCYQPEIEQAALRVINSGRYIGGLEVENMEKAIAEIAHTPYAVGVSNGLDALRLIFRGYKEMGILHDGDEVIVPANTYIASVLAVTDNNLVPVFVEPSLETLNIDTSLIESAITERTRALLTVHLYGRACFDEEMLRVANQHNLIIVEDNAQAIGATAPVAGLSGHNATGGLGHAAAFSFYPTKNIGALGDAGCVTTHDSTLANTIKALRNYGSDRQYHNIYAGVNCRLDPIQAAIVAAKLPRLEEETAHRNKIAAIYDSEITTPLVIKPSFPAKGLHVWHQYIVRTDNRDAFRTYLADRSVETAIHYPTPPHRQPCYTQFAHLNLPLTDILAETVVSLPITRCTNETDAAEIARIINGYK